MAEFRFRAAAALELRRQQETSAATSLSVAEAELRSAEKRVDEAEAGRRLAQQQQTHAERQGSDIGAITWHRNWVVRLAGVIEQERVELGRRTEIVTEAEAAWREARRKRLALERMRDRALRRFKDEERRQEMKVIDELARLRFLMVEDR
jgi:flagellar export protein FliJ